MDIQYINKIIHNEKEWLISSQQTRTPSAKTHPSHRAGQRRLRQETNLLAIQANPPTYAELVCTEKDKKLIAELTSILAKHNPIWFVIHAEKLNKKIKALKNRVHVLKILETVFTNSRLKKDIKAIYKDKTKWSAVVEETKKKMAKAEKNGQLHMYANDFALAVGAPPHEIQGYFLRKDWEGLLTYLVKRM